MVSYNVAKSLKEKGFMQDITLSYPIIKDYERKKANYPHGYFDERQLKMTRDFNKRGLLGTRYEEHYAAPNIGELLEYLPQEIQIVDRIYSLRINKEVCRYWPINESWQTKDILFYTVSIVPSYESMDDAIAHLWERLIEYKIILNKNYRHNILVHESKRINS